MAFELVDGALDGVALLVALGVELRWPATLTAMAASVVLVAAGLGDGGGLDPVSPQVGADRTAGVGPS